MDLPAVADLRHTAEQCRADAAYLQRRVATLTWAGAAAEAFHLTITAQIAALELAADQLDLAATAVRAHQVASNPLTLATTAATTAAGALNAVVKAVA